MNRIAFLAPCENLGALFEILKFKFVMKLFLYHQGQIRKIVNVLDNVDLV